jgi:tRNA-modifying protein YgfZ
MSRAELYEQAKQSVVAIHHSRDALLISGPDAKSYLQGQLSQDIDNLVVGQTTWSFVLQPHGKVDALVRVSLFEDGYLVDVDAGFGALVKERLERFKLRMKLEITQLSWSVLALRGPSSGDYKNLGTYAVDAGWGGSSGVDLFGPSIEIPAGVPVADAGLLEVLRIEAGTPAMGADLNDKTIPAELGINNLAVSFTKGCYTGQELVARIDARGNKVPRNLSGVIIDSKDDDELWRNASISVTRNGQTKVVASLTSAAYSPGLDCVVGLALVKREVLFPADASVSVDDALYSARLVKLPIGTD